MHEIPRVVTGLMTLPILSLGQLLHDAMTGRRAILRLEVKSLDDAYTRQTLLARLKRMASDAHVVGVLLLLQESPGNWAAAQDLRAAIARLRRADKAVYAWLEAAGNAQLWIASACDRVFLAPTGEVGLVGVGAELTFFGSALERLGIEPDFEAAGAYKSFGETFTRTFASPENQEAVNALVEDLHGQLVQGIAEGRKLEPAAIRDAMAHAPMSAKDAVDRGLVDRLAYQDEVEDWLKEHHGKGTQVTSYGPWAWRDAALTWLQSLSEPDTAVAVVHLEGPILMGGRGGRTIRARKVVPLLRSIREDKSIKAAVLHVNSPGGNALASDLIWREVDLLRAKKPVVACFEDVAASGGYYISAPAHEILARPGTLTGSIGVFGGKLVVGEGLRQVGVTTQEVSAAPNATVFSPTRKFTDDQRARFRASMQRFYDGFVKRVASGRRRPEDVIEPHCRGRVWTGRHAADRGLVDAHGDLFDAVERARVLAGLPLGAYRRVDVVTWPKRVALASMLAHALQSGTAGVLTRLERWVSARAGAMVEVALDSGGTLMAAMLPFDLRLR